MTSGSNRAGNDEAEVAISEDLGAGLNSPSVVDAMEAEFKTEAIGKGANETERVVCADHTDYAKPYTTKLQKLKRYSSDCAYRKEMGSCQSSYIRKMCRKTCTGRGSDQRHMQKPVTRRVPVMEERQFESRCHYEKEKQGCDKKHVREKCHRTCNACDFGKVAAMLAEYQRQIKKLEEEKAAERKANSEKGESFLHSMIF